MSDWQDHQLTERCVEILHAAPRRPSVDHHFGPPFLTAYQLAIGIDAAYPEIRQALGLTLGGLGSGENTSFSQYIARQLSGRISAEGDGFPIEGAFLSSVRMEELRLRGTDGQPVVSSLPTSSLDVSMFRVNPGHIAG